MYPVGITVPLRYTRHKPQSCADLELFSLPPNLVGRRRRSGRLIDVKGQFAFPDGLFGTPDDALISGGLPSCCMFRPHDASGSGQRAASSGWLRSSHPPSVAPKGLRVCGVFLRLADGPIGAESTRRGRSSAISWRCSRHVMQWFRIEGAGDRQTGQPRYVTCFSIIRASSK